MKTLFLFLTLSLSPMLFATDQELEIKANHGGIVKKITKGVLEVVHNKEKTNIYVRGVDHKDLMDRKLTINAIAHVKGKEFPLKLSLENNIYSVSPASYLKEEKNFILKLSISFDGKVENTQFHLKND